jgi:putative oxidoreductase
MIPHNHSAITLKDVFIEVICFLLVVLFLYASMSKYLNYQEFTGDMLNQPFPHWLAGFFILTVPATEILIILLLAIGSFGGRLRLRMFGLYASLVLMSLFTIYTVIILLHFFPRVPCSCGGVIKRLSWTQHMMLNLFFVIITIAGIRLSKGKNRNHALVNHSKAISLKKCRSQLQMRPGSGTPKTEK